MTIYEARMFFIGAALIAEIGLLWWVEYLLLEELFHK